MEDEKVAVAHCFYEIFNTIDKLFGSDKKRTF